ncbi:DNA/RNA non-specific endonuclease [Polyangium sp. 6x1]|uniref:DNA/RNA non-specific endonuclease n=1 Tax=Polyangium sp. 6x1 TaxID=3042689 RepID=UPI0024830CCC|nr:DNA/RNA non-specific endonuclease [Polyangium sp. 6x1]MDI1448671.1 DNA/RNA non-specific endonuclease [Polyangium sp. 6x1]
MGTIVWVKRQGLDASLGFTFRAQVERLPARKARTLSIEGPVRNVDLPRKQAFGVSSRSPFDHRGHLIAERFGGPNSSVNLVAMHGLVNMNGGPWYAMEVEIARMLDASGAHRPGLPRTGWMKVTVRYHSADPLRPIAFHVEAKDPNGTTKFWQIFNANPHLSNPNDPRRAEANALAVDLNADIARG